LVPPILRNGGGKGVRVRRRKPEKGSE